MGCRGVILEAGGGVQQGYIGSRVGGDCRCARLQTNAAETISAMGIF